LSVGAAVVMTAAAIKVATAVVVTIRVASIVLL
jgi:hypothetical protein